MEVKNKIEDLSLDELFADLYDVEQDRIMEENAKKEYQQKIGHDKGLEEGRKKGLEEGKKEGITARNIEIAKNMLKDGLEKQIISKYTGLKIEELENLNN